MDCGFGGYCGNRVLRVQGFPLLPSLVKQKDREMRGLSSTCNYTMSNIRNKALGFVIALFAMGGLYVPSAFAAGGNGTSIPTTVNGVTYTHKLITINGGGYLVQVYNDTAETCTGISGTCNTPVSSTGYIGNGHTAGNANAAYLQGGAGGGSQGHLDALRYTCNDLITDCAYPSGGNSGSTFGDFYNPWFSDSATLYFTDLPLKDWNNGGANDADVTTPNTRTRIVAITPINGTTTQSIVDFSLHAYINPSDVGNIIKIQVVFRNIDQNDVIGGVGSYVLGIPNFTTITFFSGLATTTGDWYFATSTFLRDGNYRTDVTLDSCASAFGTCLTQIPFYGVHDQKSTQFIVNKETLIGHISQQSFRLYGNLLASTSATTTIGDACSPIKASGTFGFEFNASSSIEVCLGYLFIPDAGQMKDSFDSFKNAVLVLAPWGYLTRFIAIMATSSTTTLPSINYTFDSNSPLHGDTWNIDTNSMIAGGGALLESVQNIDSHRTLRDVFYTIVQLIVAIAVVYQIVHDLTGSHAHTQGMGQENGRGRKV